MAAMAAGDGKETGDHMSRAAMGSHERIYRRNRKRIMMQQSVCAICGRPVDMELVPPDPMSPTVDHIIPISKGGHPSDMGNLQLAHWICNRLKSDKMIDYTKTRTNRSNNIKVSRDWKNF